MKDLREEKSEEFRNEIKDILTGIIADKDTVNYVTLRIGRIHDKCVTDVLKEYMYI